MSAVDALLKLFRLFFSLLSSFSVLVHSLLALFPASMYSLKKFLSVDENNFTKFSCHSLYYFKDCFETYGRQKKPKVCSYVAFPEHPHPSRRKICGARLVAEVTLKSWKIQYYPRKYYCYKPLLESLASLARQEGFLKHCELW